MRRHIARKNIANGIDAGDARLEVGVHLDARPAPAHAGILEPYPLDERSAAGSQEHRIPLGHSGLARALIVHLEEAVLTVGDLVRPGTELDVDTLAPHADAQALRQARVDGSQEPLHLEEGYLAAQRSVDAGKLDAHDAATDHHQAPGLLLQFEQLIRGDHPREVVPRDPAGAAYRARRDDDGPGGELLNAVIRH